MYIYDNTNTISKVYATEKLRHLGVVPTTYLAGMAACNFVFHLPNQFKRRIYQKWLTPFWGQFKRKTQQD